MKKEFEIKDSGERATFSTGMTRDSSAKVRYGLIPTWMLTRFAKHLTMGSVKYKPRNWEKAKTPEELDRFIESAWRHWIQLLENETTEDHFSALVFNLCGMELVKERLGSTWKKQLDEFRMKEGDL